MKRIAFGAATVTRKVDGEDVTSPNTLQFATGTSPDNAPGAPTVKIKSAKGEKTVAAVDVPADVLTYESPETVDEIRAALGEAFDTITVKLYDAASKAQARSTVTGELRKLTVLPSDVASFVSGLCDKLTLASLAEASKRGGGKGRQSEASKALADIASALSAGATAEDLRAMLAARGIAI